jgi:hypothetical protein
MSDNYGILVIGAAPEPKAIYDHGLWASKTRSWTAGSRTSVDPSIGLPLSR